MSEAKRVDELGARLRRCHALLQDCSAFIDLLADPKDPEYAQLALDIEKELDGCAAWICTRACDERATSDAMHIEELTAELADARQTVERLREEMAGHNCMSASMAEALNSGDGSYKP